MPLTWLGPVPLRREIRSLQSDFPDQWNLYLLGLKDFQEVDEGDLQSYYQIAGKASSWCSRCQSFPRGMHQVSDVRKSGIHGLPFTAWNGVVGDQVAGYCTHSSILFPTWHRPYLALFEVSLAFW